LLAQRQYRAWYYEFKLDRKGWILQPHQLTSFVEKDKVRAAYHRAEYLDERRRLMQAWADKLDEVEEGVG